MIRTWPGDLPGILWIEPEVHADSRGFVLESFNARELERAAGIATPFLQENHARSGANVLRGLHYQVRSPQGKLVTRAERRNFRRGARRS